MKNKKILLHFYVGCSGFYYKEWKKSFYPEKLPQKNWFEFYCRNFNSIELNTTFYRFPQVQFLEKWFQSSPEDFAFSVKVPRLITHYKKLHDCKRLLNDFYTTVEQGLKQKLAAVLFQLPAIMQYTDETLAMVVSSVREPFLNVFEFRHASWWNQQVYDALAQRNIVFCNISHPSLPSRLVFNSHATYVRMHGVPSLYNSCYSVPQLRKLTREVIKSGCDPVFIYYNNTSTIAAVSNAQFTARQLEAASKPALKF